MNPITNHSESAPLTTLHQDIYDFERYTKDPTNWYKQIPHLYLGQKLEFDEQRQTVVVITGTSAAGKDRVIDETAQVGVPWTFATTGTSRSQRSDEVDGKYIWFRPQHKGESWDQYKRNIYDEYNLIEADEHYGNFYGLPLASLQKVMERNGVIPLIRTDVNGAITIQERLSDRYNVVVITILPDALSQMHDEVKKRAIAEGQDAEQRIKEDMEKLKL